MGPFSLIAEKENNDAIILTNSNDWVVQFTGFNPPKAALYSTEMAGQNGAKYQGSRLNTRNVVLTFTILRNVQASRLLLSKFFRSGEKIKLVYAGLRRVMIEGVVETYAADRFKNTRKQIVQISLICYEPELMATEEIEVTPSSGSATFYYGGDLPGGFTIELACSGAVTNPVISDASGNSLTITDSFVADDVITINTVRGHKAAISSNDGTDTNLIGKVAYGSVWLQLMPGENTISFTADSGAANITAVYKFTPRFLEAI